MNRSGEFAAQLLQKARDDRHVLERLLNDPDAAAWTLGFHAQQAVEKSIKAVLCASGVEFPRTHNLQVLMGLLKGGLPPDAKDLLRLTPYGVLMRYDAAAADETSTTLDRAWASLCVRRTIEWAEAALAGKK